MDDNITINVTEQINDVQIIIDEITDTVQIIVIDGPEDLIQIIIKDGSDAREIREEWVDPVCYVGKAPAGSAEDEAVWNLYKITIAADGSTALLVAVNKKWTDRLTIIYT